jgi:glycosyltransferase Alg8
MKTVPRKESSALEITPLSRPIFGIEGLPGFAVYTLLLGIAASMLPPVVFVPGEKQFIVALGAIAIWRYSWGMVHFCRAMIYRKSVFPYLRAKAEAGGDSLMPPYVYLLVTSFRIAGDTTMEVYRSVIREAIDCGIPATVVCSIVELGDEFLIKELFRQAKPSAHVKLQFVRIAGTGKRDALAQGFRAISRDMPEPGAIAAVIDGDCILGPDLVRKCAPFFRMMPNLGALTTDEDCNVEGSRIMTEWHRLRFAQRHLLMSSVSLSHKVMTLTGRMSVFRAEILAHPEFIKHVEADSVQHWRLGYFKFLTGDDKSSWQWVLKYGYDMLYIPDVLVKTVEHPPSKSFCAATTKLMMRWFGNMLRINGKAAALGPARTGLFVWWCIIDQRISMWTSLTGPTFAILLTIKHSWSFLPVYLVWIGLTRWVMTVMLLAARPVVSWRYPFLIYYNQIWGSCIKTYVLFRLDRQSWTRQKTSLNRNLTFLQQSVLNSSSVVLHGVAILAFVTLIGLLAGIFTIPSLKL